MTYEVNFGKYTPGGPCWNQFDTFVQKSGASEIAKLFMAVQKYVETPSCYRLKLILKNYVKENAPDQVNISNHHREKFCREVERFLVAQAGNAAPPRLNNQVAHHLIHCPHKPIPSGVFQEVVDTLVTNLLNPWTELQKVLAQRPPRRRFRPWRRHQSNGELTRPTPRTARAQTRLERSGSAPNGPHCNSDGAYEESAIFSVRCFSAEFHGREKRHVRARSVAAGQPSHTPAISMSDVEFLRRYGEPFSRDSQGSFSESSL